MVATAMRRYTAADLARMPSDAPYELWRGELVYVGPSGVGASSCSIWIAIRLGSFVESHDLGLVTGEAGGYILFAGTDDESVVAPDVGFVRWDRLPGRTRPKGYCPIPPDLAIEVTSPSDKPGKTRDKLDLYREAGVPFVWWVDEEQRLVRVYRPGQPAVVAGEGDVLEAPEILPGFRLRIADVLSR